MQPLTNGIISGCVYALVATGFGLIYNATKTFHFAHGAVYTVSGYLLYAFLNRLGFSLVISILGAISGAIVLGAIIELIIYQPLVRRKAHPNVILISSLGTYIVLINCIALVFGNEAKTIHSAMEKTYFIGNVILTQIQVIELIVSVILFSVILLIMKRTKLGWSIRALANSPLLATVIGIDVERIRISVFAIGSGLAGVAAILLARDIGIDPNIGFPILFVSAVAAIIGGVNVLAGAVVGAFLLGVIQNLVLWTLSVRWQETITFLILILFLLFRPQGILGVRKRRIEEQTV